jgi:hypothetical protein
MKQDANPLCAKAGAALMANGNIIATSMGRMATS